MTKKKVTTIGTIMMMTMLAVTPIPAVAKSVTAGKIIEKAKKVKTGSVTIKVPKNGSFGKGYVIFTAPKKGTYTFQFKNMQAIPKNPNAILCGAVYMETKKGNGSPSNTTVKTQGGKYDMLNLCTKKFREMDILTSEGKAATNNSARTYLTKRSCSLKLKKKQSVWIYCSFAGGKSSIDMTIKAK